MPRLPFMPKEEKFFKLFYRSAENMVIASGKLRELFYGCESIERTVAEITEYEHQGDSITHEILSLLHRTFITPFDREDIASLAHTLDDVTDLIDAASDAMLIYKIDVSTIRAKELSDILVDATSSIKTAIPLLERRSDLKNILRYCVEINRFENVADRLYRAAMGELFEECKDIALIIKWREIYEYLETATDRCEDVANVFEGIALKHG
jgi:predicted phosphate transport protein (TIGR00153 family)